MMGAERKSAVIAPEVRKLTAYHEGGHAIVAHFTQGTNPTLTLILAYYALVSNLAVTLALLVVLTLAP